MPLFRELQAILVELSEGRQLAPEIQDQGLSYGERMSSLIVAEALRHTGIHAAQVDARKVIVTDEQFTHATPLYWDTYARLRRTVALVARDRVVVMGGFIGSTSTGVTTMLGRGGSDLTASLAGNGISPDEIQMWTDVHGMLTCDPRVLAGGWHMREIGYAEAQEMARCGAKVRCPASIEPALWQRIPIVIRNSRRPGVAGTRIVSILHLRVRNRGMLSSITDGLADLFAREHVSVDLIQATGQGISFAVRNRPGLSAVLRKVDESVEIEVEENRAAVWRWAEGVASRVAALTLALAVLSTTNIRLTSHGSSSLSLGVVVPESDLHAAMKALHAEFFTTPDREVFVAPEFTPLGVTQPACRRSHPRQHLTSQVVPAPNE